MVHSRLSDEETEVLFGYCAANKPVALVKYVNRLLQERSAGAESCARPLAYREKMTHDSHPCFALGYMDKILSFIEEEDERSPMTVVRQTTSYVNRLKYEITQYFTKNKRTTS